MIVIIYFSIEEGSGEVGFENKIIETIVKEAETDHILDNERPKDRKLIVEDLIEQKKVIFLFKDFENKVMVFRRNITKKNIVN